MVIQERQRPIARQGRQPQRQASELYGHGIHVHAVQAALRHEAAKFGAIGVTDVRGRQLAVPYQGLFVGVREVTTGRDEKRSASHRRIENLEVKDVLRPCGFDERRQRSSHQIFGQRTRRVKRARGFAPAAGSSWSGPAVCAGA